MTRPLMDPKEPVVSRQRYVRERTAREAAEHLLEHKSRALFEANQNLQQQADLLEQKVAERTADLERARRQAEAASEAKSTFLAAMSHEIRTPLNGILGMAAALEDTGLTTEQRRILDVVTDSGELLLHVINDILDLSKIESGETELETVPFDLAEALRSAQALYGLRAQEKGLGFAVDLDASCAQIVKGDETRLRQILNNLVSNAIKFTDAGGVSLRAQARQVGRPDADARLLVTIEVEDTGVGVQRDQIPNLFKPFTQADASITRRFGGSGLGLAITAQLVEMMGGTITVDSTYGRGSVFTVMLAFGVGTVPAEAGHAPETEDIGALLDRVRAMEPRILVAEDNATNRMVLAHRFKRLGLTADFVTDGAQAVARCQPGAYDVVLMDVHMPAMDGVTATRAIRTREAASSQALRLPIIAFSADALREQVARYLEAGMDAHLAKPGDRDDLVRVLARVLT